MRSLGVGIQLGDYTITRLIGRGGMGEVYEAVENKLQRRVAIKIITPEEQDSGELIRRFLQEARTLAKVNHPNVVTIYAIDKIGDMQFIAMELVDGISLKDFLLGSKLTADEAVPIFEQMLEGLKCLHDNHIIHRDLKPSNILLRPNGQIKILDFGIAKQVDDLDSEETRVGVIIGTAPYMPPEMKAGIRATMLSDYWSLGAIFYECLVGKPLAIVMKKYPTAPEIVFSSEARARIPQEMRDIVCRLCATRPIDRYADIPMVIEALRGFRNRRPPPAFGTQEALAEKVEALIVASRKIEMENSTLTRLKRALDKSSPTVIDPDQTALRVSTAKGLKKTWTIEIALGVVTLLLFATALWSKKDLSQRPRPVTPSHVEADDMSASDTSIVKATPAPMALLEPEDHKVLALDPSQLPTFLWSHPLAPGTYDIQIAKDSDFKKIIVQEPVSGNSFRPARVLSEGRYYWRLFPVKSGQPPVEPQEFAISQLSPVELGFPSAKRVYEIKEDARTANVDFSWTCKPGVNDYRIQLSRSIKFTEPSLDRIVSGCRLNEAIVPIGTHYWRVKAEGTEKAEWSEERDLVVRESREVKISRPVVVESKTETGKIAVTLQFKEGVRGVASIADRLEQFPAFEWRPEQGARSYVVQLSSEKDFSQLNSEESVNVSKLVWRYPTPGRTYWRARAYSSTLMPGRIVAQGEIDIRLPAPKLRSNYKSGVIDWKSVPLAERYIVKVAPTRSLANAEVVNSREPRLKLSRGNAIRYVRVATADAAGELTSDFSNTAEVEPGEAFALPRPVAVAPRKGARAPASSGRLSVAFSWSPVPSAESYLLVMSSDPEFSKIIESRKLSEPASVLKQAKLSGRVYWRVRAENSKGVSDWSEVSYFDVK